MLCALNDCGAEYLVVGAFALASYGPARSTGDLDIWVRPTPENAERVWAALVRFGAPRRRLSLDDFCTLDNVIQIGIAPNRIDLLTSVTGVEFDEAWRGRKQQPVGDLLIPVIGRAHLLKNKRATGRPKDLADVAWLEAADK